MRRHLFLIPVALILFIFAAGILINAQKARTSIAEKAVQTQQTTSKNLINERTTQPTNKKVNPNQKTIPEANSITATSTANPTASHQPTLHEEKVSYTAGIQLVIIAPEDGSTTNTSSVTIKGKTAPRVDVFVNDNELKSDANGNFSSKISLDEGDNLVTISANDLDGNFAEREIIVVYEPKT